MKRVRESLRRCCDGAFWFVIDGLISLPAVPPEAQQQASTADCSYRRLDKQVNQTGSHASRTNEQKKRVDFEDISAAMLFGQPSNEQKTLCHVLRRSRLSQSNAEGASTVYLRTVAPNRRPSAVERLFPPGLVLSLGHGTYCLICLPLNGNCLHPRLPTRRRINGLHLPLDIALLIETVQGPRRLYRS